RRDARSVRAATPGLPDLTPSVCHGPSLSHSTAPACPRAHLPTPRSHLAHPPPRHLGSHRESAERDRCGERNRARLAICRGNECPSRSAVSDWCSVPSAGFAGAICFGGGSEGGRSFLRAF